MVVTRLNPLTSYLPPLSEPQSSTERFPTGPIYR